MANYIETKVKYLKLTEKGVQKKVTETYLVDAVSFGEAEFSAINDLKDFLGNDYEVTAVRKSGIAEIIRANDDGEKFFKVKAGFITLDEKTGTEKRRSVCFLIQESDFNAAVKGFDEYMKGTLSDYEITSISESPILDIITKDTDDGRN